ncbi:MAG: NUDIX domain-containing protein [Candidatus Moranbacteria bacterium]|nr:NUDIX domain-containing protein [Candidatus Moranbacteria bacterium]
MIYTKKPEKFNPRFEIVSCFVECGGDILLLHRQDHKPQGDTWGVVAGKVDDGEDVKGAMMREFQEEIGFQLPEPKLSHFKKVYVRCSEYDFVDHMFHVELDRQQKIVLRCDEHKDFKWVSPKDALQMPLIEDLDACIELFYEIK